MIFQHLVWLPIPALKCKRDCPDHFAEQIMFPFRTFLSLTVLLAGSPASFARNDAVKMAESFAVGQRSRVDFRVDLSGELNAPGKAGSRIELSGTAVLQYDERVLPADEPGTGKVLRIYRAVDFSRTLAGETQKQDIRLAVRRMVVLRSAEGKKAPFSPDGPLTFGEIDAVRVDLYSPVLVDGLLPAKAVRPGETWTASEAATLDLTGLDSLDGGKLTVEYVGPVRVGGRDRYRLAITGSIKGVSEDGPTRQAIDATAYFDPDENRLSYLSLKGTQELLDGSGKVVGKLTGRFTMNRSATRELGDDSVSRLDARLTAENTLLLYDNPDLGIRFVHPRHWRVGAVQGRQVTIEDPKGGGGILVTVESADRIPTPAAYQKEAVAFIESQKGKVFARGSFGRKDGFDRFTVEAELNGESCRMEYAVRKEATGGMTVAARIPASRVEAMLPDVNRILKDMSLTKAIK
jgi:hypothetical protein